MRRMNLALVLVMVGVPAAMAQRGSSDAATITPRFDVSLGYSDMNANAPPGVTDYFGLNGGYVSGSFHIINWLSIAGQVTGGHANDISLLGQDLTLLTFVAGPRVSLTGHRLVPFGQVLFGGAHGSDSYFPTATSYSSNASSWALSTGGGLDVSINRRFAVRALDVEYVKTALPNGSTNTQNHLTVGAGIVINFGGRDVNAPVAHVAAQRPSEIDFSCSTNFATIDQGQVLEIIGHAKTEPDQLQVSYSWSSNGGQVEGTGRRVTINTTGMGAGEYRVTGHAALISSPSTTAECEAVFRVNGHVETAAAPATQVLDQAETAKNDVIFHENVQDALFDYDSYQIRSDAQAAIVHAADYLKAHPAIRVLIGGYSDERGSAEYNLALGEKRANAARDALIAEGVPADRLQIISYGKEAQVCTAENESCWQQNRRAAFSLHP
jgi:peptidoglycan-associated lipoprotein